MTRTPRPIQHVERLAALLVIAAAMFSGLAAVRFHPDESHWIGLSAPFEAFFTGRFTDPIWQERQDKIVNATVTFYVIGAARRIGGYTPERLNAPYRFGMPYDENLVQGRVPSPGLLWWGRAGVTVTAMVAVYVLFQLLMSAAGRPAAYVWLALVLVNPYLRDVSRRAMNEGVLLCFLALVSFATSRALPHLDRPKGAPGAGRRGAAWLAAAGFAAGLAAQTKLNGGLAIPAILLIIALAAIRAGGPWRWRARQAALAAVLVMAASAAAFVGANPTLWPNPARATLEAARARSEVLTAQMTLFPEEAMPALSRRVSIASKRVFYDDALIPRTLTGIVLFLAGAIVTGGQVRLWQQRRGHNHALVALAVVGAVVSLPAFVSPLDWPRYYVLPVFFFSVQIVVGMDWLARRVWLSLSQARAGR